MSTVSPTPIYQIPVVFQNRLDAARQLATALEPYRNQNPLVLALPRGAVPMGKALAAALECDFDVVLVRKLGAPGHPELAVGAIDENGQTFLQPQALLYGADADYLKAEKERQMHTIRRRRAQYTPLRPPLKLAGRTAIVVDDGLATGATMTAALHSVRAQKPRKLVCAVPVASPEALENIGHLADEVVCLQAPEFFQAVGQFYRDFGQVEDSEVIALLKR